MIEKPEKRNMTPQKWLIGIDTGGTFTDCHARDPRGRVHRIKVLSNGRLRGRLLGVAGENAFHIEQNWRLSDWSIFEGYHLYLPSGVALAAVVQGVDARGGIILLDRSPQFSGPVDFEIGAEEEAPILAARLATATPLSATLPPLNMRLGTTKGTNALLERKGARAALIITKGFGDLVAIGTQQRPFLFQLSIPPPNVLYDLVVEVDERMDAQGGALIPLSEREIERVAILLRESGISSAAVAFLHAYRNPAHELALGEAFRAAGVDFVSLSHALTPAVKLLPRCQTALVNAYLAPVLHGYLRDIEVCLGEAGRANLQIMTSAGGLVGAAVFHAKDSLLSGPAGGVVGAARVARQLGFSRVLTLDMGGTSTDTARYDAAFDYRFNTAVDRIEMLSPSLAIETVAAGGGSCCYFDGKKLCVGPQSAGAVPGPACYGAGGPLTITDVNLLLGKFDPSAMGIPVHVEPARAALRAVQEEVSAAIGVRYSSYELLEGFEKIADEKMSEAIRRISVAEGFDPRDYALLAFGGAGGMHACRIAEQLGIDTIILPYDAGLLSAYGISKARVERIVEKQVMQALHEAETALSTWFGQLDNQAMSALEMEGIDPGDIEIVERLVFLRFAGQEHSVEMNYRTREDLGRAFAEKYRRLFGHFPEGRVIEVESLRVIAGTREPAAAPASATPEKRLISPRRFHQPAYGVGVAVAIIDWERCIEGEYYQGPAILINPSSAAYVAPGWHMELVFNRGIVLRYRGAAAAAPKERGEAVELELFANRFAAIAEEMGAQLRRTAFSVNVKERLDFSCALLDERAELLANAPHIPVHLGSLGVCARAILRVLPLGAGDVAIVNHPRYGGSHLPDITLLSAVHDDENCLLGYVINRAHHAEIGGRRPGSMPPDARNLAEEGVVIPPTYLMKDDVARWEELEKRFTEAPYPTRALQENLADINAALASLRAGSAALRALARRHGREKIHRYMALVKAAARQEFARALAPFEGQTRSALERLDDGSAIKVRLEVREGRARLDFSGTAPTHRDNLNANAAIVHSAVLYLLRVLCDRDLPLNEGMMRQIDLYLPPGTLLNPVFVDDPARCPAVVGGNTEVSQRLVDALLKAFELAACSQGTMNNFLFGNERFGYYETIGGGAGATPAAPGRDAVHQHMTNTRITDPEELELRYPVRLWRFAIRRGSGGAGLHRGGDGIIREMEFLEEMEATLLSQHRVEAPYGMHGGMPGKVGMQLLISVDGSVKPLKGIAGFRVGRGDRVRIETPGGGGWGAPAASAE
jgi:5-oxoprolinase (ATP-hydrolysing)